MWFLSQASERKCGLRVGGRNRLPDVLAAPCADLLSLCYLKANEEGRDSNPSSSFIEHVI